MPPKKAATAHPMAPDVASGTKFSDTRKIEYTVGKRFASGGFGHIYTCTSSAESGELALKVEPATNGPLFTEINVFQRILKLASIKEYEKAHGLKRLGVPPLISTGIFDYKGSRLRFLVMKRYATSLDNTRGSDGRLPAKSALAAASAVARALEYIQDCDYVHADVKGANVLLERPADASSAVLVDYGLARNASSNEEKPDPKRKHNGTPLFTSVDAHDGLQPSYRGDLEQLAYNIWLWITGSLPWSSDCTQLEEVRVAKEKIPLFEKIAASKRSFKTASGTAKDAPPAVVSKLLKLAHGTKYTEKVDYTKVQQILEAAELESQRGRSNVLSPLVAAASSTARKRPSADSTPSVTKKAPAASTAAKTTATKTTAAPTRTSTRTRKI